MVAVWSALSFAIKGAPEGVPRRLALPNTWDVKETWTVAKVSSLFLLKGSSIQKRQSFTHIRLAFIC